jgi:hypothetical protein
MKDRDTSELPKICYSWTLPKCICIKKHRDLRSVKYSVSFLQFSFSKFKRSKMQEYNSVPMRKVGLQHSTSCVCVRLFAWSLPFASETLKRLHQFFWKPCMNVMVTRTNQFLYCHHDILVTKQTSLEKTIIHQKNARSWTLPSAVSLQYRDIYFVCWIWNYIRKNFDFIPLYEYCRRKSWTQR